MVTVATPRAMVAPVGCESSTKKVSSGSAVRSPDTLKEMAAEVWPGENVSVPSLATKSEPAVAVPLRLANATVAGDVVGPDRVNVTVTVLQPLRPSRIEASPMENCGSAPVTVTFWSPVVTFPDGSVAVQVIVVVPTAKTLPVGTPVRVIRTDPELSVPVAVPSSASPIVTDVAAPMDRLTAGGTVSVGRSSSRTVTRCT